MSERLIRLEIARVEAAHLLRLVSDLLDLIDDDDATDPALSRLTPSPYPGDDAASAEYAAVTRTDLLGRRSTDARQVTRALAPAVAFESDDDGLEHYPLDIAGADIDAWLRTLTALRVVIATRLGIIDEDEHDDDDPRFGMYDWLGFRLDSLVALADAFDEYDEDVRSDED